MKGLVGYVENIRDTLKDFKQGNDGPNQWLSNFSTHQNRLDNLSSDYQAPSLDFLIH